MKILVSRRMLSSRTFRPKEIFVEWLEKNFTCNDCGCQFQLNERSDKGKIVAVLQDIDGGHVGVNGVVVYRIPCPDAKCLNMVKIGSVPEGERSIEEIDT